MSRRRKPGQQRIDAPPSRKVWRLARVQRVWLLLIAAVLGAGIGGFYLVQGFWPADGWLGSSEAGPQVPGSLGARRPTLRVGARSTPATRAEINALQEEAVQVVDGLRADFPDSSDPLVLLGNLYENLGNSAQAMECWQQSLDVDPQRADAYRGLGSLAMRKGQYEQALQLWGKALEIRPEMPEVRTFSARALMALGRPAEAAAALEREVQLSPRTSTSYFELGQAYRQLKEYRKAKESYQAAVKIQPAYTNAHYGLALACEKLGQPDESARYMAQFQRLKAANRQTEKDSRSAYDDLAAARRAVAQTHTDAAQVYYGHGHLQQARQHWEKAARLDPHDTACRMQLVRLHTQAGRDQDALRICEELRQIEPKNATTYLNIAVLSARLGRLDAALSAIDRAIELDPDHPEFQRARQLIQERKRRGEFP